MECNQVFSNRQRPSSRLSRIQTAFYLYFWVYIPRLAPSFVVGVEPCLSGPLSSCLLPLACAGARASAVPKKL